jgi:hypothetical protein
MKPLRPRNLRHPTMEKKSRSELKKNKQRTTAHCLKHPRSHWVLGGINCYKRQRKGNRFWEKSNPIKPWPLKGSVKRSHNNMNSTQGSGPRWAERAQVVPHYCCGLCIISNFAVFFGSAFVVPDESWESPFLCAFIDSLNRSWCEGLIVISFHEQDGLVQSWIFRKWEGFCTVDLCAF